MPFVSHPVRLGARLVLFLVCGGAVGGPLAHAQEAEPTAVVQGFVRDGSSGGSLQGANIVLRDTTAQIAFAGVTDGRGFYQVSGIRPGRYQLTVTFVGYRSYRDTVRLSAGDRRTVSVALTPTPRRLGEVTVEGRGTVEEAEAGLREISPADVETIPTPGPGGDLASYLRSLPGVTSLGDRGGRLFVRGGSPAQNLVLVDGAPVYRPFHIVGFYSAFPSDVISDTKFYAGGFGAEYMRRTSSVLDVQLRPGNTQEYQGSVGIGPFLTTGHVEGPLQQGEQSFLVHARHSLIEHTGPSLLGTDAPYKFYDVTAKMETQGESSQCSFTAVRTYDRGRIDPDQGASIRWDNTSVGGNCLVFSDASAQTLNVSFGTSHFNNTVRSTDETVRTAGTWKAHTKWVLRQPAIWNGTVSWGGMVQADKYDFSLDEPFLGLDPEMEDRFLISASTHVGAEWEWADRLTVKPSVGAQALFAWEGVSVDPRVRVAYRPGARSTTKLTAAGGIYHQIPTGIADERDAGSNFRVWLPTPFRNKPLQSRHALLGWDQQFLPALRLGIEGWYKQLRDLPVPRWTPIVRFNTDLARADGTAYGIDASLDYHRDPFRLQARYGYGRVTYRAAEDRLGAWGENALVEYAPPHDVRHKLSLVAGVDTEWGSANVRWQYTTGRPFTQVYGYDTLLEVRGLRDPPNQVIGVPRALYDRPYEGRLPSYHRLDVSVQRTVDITPSTDITAEAGAINAYNRANVFYIDIFTLDRVDQLSFIPYLSLELNIR